MLPHIDRVVPILGLLFVVWIGPPAVSQERRGPKTLENLLDATAEVTPHGTVSRPPGGSSEPEIDEAWQRYVKSVQKASAGLLKRLAPIGVKANGTQSKPSSMSDASTGKEAARRGFVEQGRLPSMLDVGLRTARLEVEQAYRDAADALGQRYAKAVESLRKAGRGDEAEAIVQEWTLLQHALDMATEPQLDSTWQHSIENGPSAEITLYSNGTIDAPDGPDTWTLNGTKLVIRWKNTEAPGGEWIDTCEVAPHAGSYSGTNQLGTRISGKRLQ